MSNAVIYRRVSTGEQAESGLGLEAQAATCQAAASRLGLTVAGTFTDAGVSGSTEGVDRAGFMAALEGLGSGDVLLVAKRDRLGRDVIAVAMLERLVEKKGARIVSAAGEGTESSDPSAVLMRRMVDAFAEYERLLIGARTRAALGALKARGVKLGAPVAIAWAAVQRIRELRASGLALRKIAAALDAEGFAPVRGAKWNPMTIRRALKRAA
jgi:DNA invertase Pin-like site-specific DNA recombinase